jgi:hypothetical protein
MSAMQMTGRIGSLVEDAHDLNAILQHPIVDDVPLDESNAAPGKEAGPALAGFRIVPQGGNRPSERFLVPVALLLAPLLPRVGQDIGEIDPSLRREDDWPFRA